MLRLSRLTDYAAVVLGAMSKRDGALVSAAALAEETGVPEPTAAKILKHLARDGIVASVRGASGGYRLERPAAEISIGAVVMAVEGPIALTACVEGSNQDCGIKATCPLQGRWSPVNQAIRAALESVSVADILNQPCCSAHIAADIAANITTGAPAAAPPESL